LTDHAESSQMGGKWISPSNCPMSEKCWLWITSGPLLHIAYNQRKVFSARPRQWGLCVPGWAFLHSRAPCQVECHSCGIREVVQEKKELFQLSKRTSLENELRESGNPKQGQQSWNKVHVAGTKDLSKCKI
jgi:hypothetical protein